MIYHRIYRPDQFMNPGPAPRPPTDRPRLALTPQVYNVAGNSLSGTTLNSPVQSGMSRTETSNGEFGVVKEGWAKVKEEGGFMKVFWSEKFLVLREKQLDFLKSNNSNKVSFSISLKDVSNITRSESYPVAFELSRSLNGATTGAQKLLICKFETDTEVYAWIDSIYDRCPSMGGVSHPTGFSHRVHVGFDPVTGGFVGLPVEWERLLKGSALTKDDMAKNPQAVMEVLQFYTDKLQTRAEDPNRYPSLTPTPGPDPQTGKQLGYAGAGVGSIAPQRPQPPRQDSYASMRSQTSTPANGYSRERTPDRYGPPSRSNTAQDMQRQEDERRRKQEDERRRAERAEEERRRREQEEYNASIPKARTPLAKQEIGGYGGDSRDASPSPARSQDRYQASRPAPQAPTSANKERQQPPSSLPLRSLQAQRPAPAPPGAQNGSSQSIPKLASPSKQPNGQQNSVKQPGMTNGQAQPLTRKPSGTSHNKQPSAGVNSAVKPLNVQTKQPTGAPKDPIKAAEMALTKKADEPARKDVRMSAMNDAQVMEKLRDVVSKDKPLDSYNKQKKIGQGASGSVYVARIRESAPSQTAKNLLREHGPRAQVAIKQMDLRSQPRKELIVNEIIVMKDSKHPNIVNFLDAFLQEENYELWVVMEFMEGGALTDVIDNNPSITEDQIATICFEVRIGHSFQSYA